MPNRLQKRGEIDQPFVRHALDEVEGNFILFGSSSFAQRCDHLFLQISNDANGSTLRVLDYGKASHFGDIPRL
jgi:hypothetical protein